MTDTYWYKPGLHYWQYNGIAPFNEIVKWCRLHLGPMGYDILNDKISWTLYKQEGLFLDDRSYVLFTLRWS